VAFGGRVIGRTIGALRAERKFLTFSNGDSCSARHELRPRAFLFIVSVECALPTNASVFLSPLEGGLDLVTSRQDAI